MRCYTRHRHRRRSKSKSKSILHLMFTANTKRPMTSHRTVEKVAANALGVTNNKPAPNFPPGSPKKLPSSSTSLSPSSDVLCPHSLSSRSPSSAVTVTEGEMLAIQLETQEDMVRQTLGSIQKGVVPPTGRHCQGHLRPWVWPQARAETVSCSRHGPCGVASEEDHHCIQG